MLRSFRGPDLRDPAVISRLLVSNGPSRVFLEGACQWVTHPNRTHAHATPSGLLSFSFIVIIIVIVIIIIIIIIVWGFLGEAGVFLFLLFLARGWGLGWVRDILWVSF